MMRNRSVSRPDVSTIFAVFFFLSTGLLSGCSWPSFDLFSSDNEVIWRSHDEFVRLESRDGGSPNAQPIKLSRERIRGALRLIFVKESAKEDAFPLFSEYDIKILGLYLEKGLAKANPGQDVTFAITSWHKGFFGLQTERVITGRVFYVNNQLNVIFGSIMRDAPMHAGKGELTARNPDPRLNPYVPGLRAIRVKQSVIMSTPPQSGVFRATAKRPNWLVFTSKALMAHGPVAAPEQRVAYPTTAVSSDFQQLREEVNRLKQELRGGRKSIPGQQQSPPDSATIERRLAILEKLHQRGLITKEELAAKREQILRGL